MTKYIKRIKKAIQEAYDDGDFEASTKMEFLYVIRDECHGKIADLQDAGHARSDEVFE